MAQLRNGRWAAFAIAFSAYCLLSVGAFVADAPSLAWAGAVSMVLLAALGNYRTLLVFRLGPPSTWALLAIAAPLASLAANPGSAAAVPTLKYVLIFVVFLQVYAGRLVPVHRSRWRWVFVAACAFLISSSFAAGRDFQTDTESRLSGIFANPNNLALIGLALLLFVNADDAPLRQAAVHAAAIGTLAVTSTLGAIVAYAAGMAYRLRRLVTPRRAAITLVPILIGAAVAWYAVPWSQFRIVRQVQVTVESMGAATSDLVDFGDLAQSYGDSSTSALWRITMWLRVLREYAAGDARDWLLGRGMGSAVELFGILPHNEYLRLLFETGALGLLSFVGFFRAVWRGMPPDDRWTVLMFLTYSISENNLDNFLFMSMLMLFCASAQLRTGSRRRAREAIPAGRRAPQTVVLADASWDRTP